MKLKSLAAFFPALFACITSLAALPAGADEIVTVLGTLARPVKLYAAPDATSKVIDTWEANASFEAQPKAVKVVQDSFIQVEHNGKPAWVMFRSVRTSRQIRLAEACGSMPTTNVPRSATTRGVGERCK